MPLSKQTRESFFEDVVNHMAAICATPIAMVALAQGARSSGPRFWINYSDQECGRETDIFPEALLAELGREIAYVKDFTCPPALWPHTPAPRSRISIPLVLQGEFAGVLLIADCVPRVWSRFEKDYMTRAARLVAGHFESRTVVIERDRALQQLAAALDALTQERTQLELRVHDRTMALRESLRVAEAANAAKSRFLATMSHELRTPLNAIVGYAEIIEEDAAAAGRVNEAQDAVRIKSAAAHQLSLINDILDLAKIESGKTDVIADEFDVGDLVKDVAALIRPLNERNGNQLSVYVGANIPRFRSDLVRLRQCLLNLASNAAKFTKNGTVAIQAVSEMRHGIEGVGLSVIDSGMGMSRDTLSRLFTPFMQADESMTRKFGGTGLGLAITKQLIELMGGEVLVQSVEGQGSTFCLWAPACLAARGGDHAPVPAGAALRYA